MPATTASAIILSFLLGTALAMFAGYRLARSGSAAPETPAPTKLAMKPPFDQSLPAPPPSKPMEINPRRSIDLDALVRDGDLPAVKTLQALWANADDPADKLRCARALAEIGSAEAVQAMLNALSQVKDWQERRALAQSLRTVTSPRALEFLVPALGKNYGQASNAVLDEVIGCVGRLAESDTVVSIQDMLESGAHPQQRQQLIRAMASIRNEKALQALVKTAETGESDELARAALQSMNAIGISAEKLRTLQVETR